MENIASAHKRQTLAQVFMTLIIFHLVIHGVYVMLWNLIIDIVALALTSSQILNSLFLTIPKRRVQHLSAEWNNHWRWWINKLCNILIEKLFGYNQDLSCQYRSKTCQHKLSADSWYHRYYVHNIRSMYSFIAIFCTTRAS